MKDMEKDELGKLGEQLAADHLASMGYAILRRNFVFDKAEVDIVAEKNSRLVFVEVKTRRSDFLSEPEHTVSMKKQRQIIKAADAFIKANDLGNESRFDIITVRVNGEQHMLDHLEDAFFPT